MNTITDISYEEVTNTTDVIGWLATLVNNDKATIIDTLSEPIFEKQLKEYMNNFYAEYSPYQMVSSDWSLVVNIDNIWKKYSYGAVLAQIDHDIHLWKKVDIKEINNILSKVEEKLVATNCLYFKKLRQECNDYLSRLYTQIIQKDITPDMANWETNISQKEEDITTYKTSGNLAIHITNEKIREIEMILTNLGVLLRKIKQTVQKL